MSVIGIDYGNVDCVIAQAKRGGIDIILNENSNRKNPNMVCIAGKQRFIGEAAVSMARTNYKNTATDIKRLIGRNFKDADVQEEIKYLGYNCVELPSGQVGIDLNYNDSTITVTCEQVVGMMLNKLQSIAAVANDGINPAYCVLSCPGFFSDLQRRAMLNACKIAGMNCLRLMNEHTAVALGYGIYKSARNLFHETDAEHVMFIDMGHSSYTVSIVAFVQGKLQVKSVAYDRFLGGRNFDLALAEDAAAKFMEKRKVNPINDAKSRMKLLSACEKSKKNLSPHGVTSTALNIECLVEEYDYNSKVSLEEFETLIAPLLERLELPILAALKDANLTKAELSCIEIMGGATRVSSVKRRLADILELDQSKPNFGLSTTLNADESVARGCALQCAILSPLFKVKDFAIADIVEFPVRISWESSENDAIKSATNDDEGDEGQDDIEVDSNSVVIFTRKDDFPKTKRITLRRKNSFSLDACYDKTAQGFLPSNETRLNLGKFHISGLPKSTEATELPKVRVNIRQDLHGLIEIASCQFMQEVIVTEESKETTEEGAADANKEAEAKATAPAKKRFKKVDLKIESVVNGLTDAKVSAAMEEELQMAQQDRVIEETANKRNELESFVYDMRNQLSDKFNEVVTSEERSELDNQLNEMEDWLYSDEGFDSTKSVYQSKLDSLKSKTNPIELRYTENSERPIATNELKQVIEEYKRMSNSSDDLYSHWSDEDCNTLRNICNETESWLFEQLNKQANLSATANPVVTAKMIRDKIVAVRAVALPIVTKPKPLPKVENVAPPTAPVTENTESKDDENKMDLD